MQSSYILSILCPLFVHFMQKKIRNHTINRKQTRQPNPHYRAIYGTQENYYKSVLIASIPTRGAKVLPREQARQNIRFFSPVPEWDWRFCCVEPISFVAESCPQKPKNLVRLHNGGVDFLPLSFAVHYFADFRLFVRRFPVF